MSSVLIVGGLNQVTRYLVPRLSASQQNIVVVSRQEKPVWAAPSVRWLGQNERPTRIDSVVWLAPMPMLDQWTDVLTSATNVVMISSTSALIKDDSADPSERATARALQAGETRLESWAAKDRQRSASILRPTLIYGAGMDANLTRIAGFIDRFGFCPLVGAATGERQPVHADDVARAVACCLDQRAQGVEVLNLPGGETLSYRAMVEKVFRSLDRTPRFIRFPQWIVRAAVAGLRWMPRHADLTVSMFERMNRDLMFSGSAAHDRLGFTPRRFDPTRDTWHDQSRT